MTAMDDEEIPLDEIISWFEEDMDDDEDDYPYDLDDDEDDDIGHYDDDELEDSDFSEHSTSESPWVFNVPSHIEKALEVEKGTSIESYKDYVWHSLWTNVKPDEVDPAQSAADYYLLFGLINNSFIQFEPLTLPSFEELERAGIKLKKTKKEIKERQAINLNLIEKDPRSKLTKLSEKADTAMHILVDELDKSFREYVHLACGGELRHHKAFGKTLKGYRKGAWTRWYYIFEQHGVDALLQMVDLFMEFTPGSSYGGERWANAAKILYQREVGELGPTEFINKQLFVDRVFTLEHNGGCFLNKLEWANFRAERDDDYCYSFHTMKDYVLNAHAANPVDIDMLFGHASEPVQNMVKEYLDIAIENGIEVSGIWQGTVHKAEKKERVSSVGISLAQASKSDGPTSVLDWSDEVKNLTEENAKKKQSIIDSYKEKVIEPTLHQEFHISEDPMPASAVEDFLNELYADKNLHGHAGNIWADPNQENTFHKTGEWEVLDE
jgi:hypothetical protein